MWGTSQVFNRLQPSQQLATLLEVAYGLLNPATLIPELTTVRAATVIAIYRELVARSKLRLSFHETAEEKSDLMDKAESQPPLRPDSSD